jgi:hypothetical protein
MDKSKIVTSGLFAFTSAFVVYLLLKKNKKTLNFNILINKNNDNLSKNEVEDNLSINEIDDIFNEHLNKENYSENDTVEKIIDNPSKKIIINQIKKTISKTDDMIETTKKTIDINEKIDDDNNLDDFQNVTNLDKKIKFIPDIKSTEKCKVRSWFSFF